MCQKKNLEISVVTLLTLVINASMFRTNKSVFNTYQLLVNLATAPSFPGEDHTEFTLRLTPNWDLPRNNTRDALNLLELVSLLSCAPPTCRGRDSLPAPLQCPHLDERRSSHIFQIPIPTDRTELAGRLPRCMISLLRFTRNLSTHLVVVTATGHNPHKLRNASRKSVSAMPSFLVVLTSRSLNQFPWIWLHNGTFHHPADDNATLHNISLSASQYSLQSIFVTPGIDSRWLSTQDMLEWKNLLFCPPNSWCLINLYFPGNQPWLVLEKIQSYCLGTLVWIVLLTGHSYLHDHHES